MHISGKFNTLHNLDIQNENLDIQSLKVDIENKKMDIERKLMDYSSKLSDKTMHHIIILYQSFPTNYFRRNSVMEKLV